jgi:signal peptidase I
MVYSFIPQSFHDSLAYNASNMSKQNQKITTSLMQKQRFWQEALGWARAIIVTLIVTTFLVTTVGVAGSSMAPTLEGGSSSRLEAFLYGDRLFVPKYETWLKRLGIGEYQRGDIIIFREPEGKPCHPNDPGGRVLVIKRLIGVSGDHVQVFPDGSVRINEQELDQTFITEKQGRITPTPTADVTVPEGQFFVMGDNRPGSCDSRIYGTIPFISVTGKAGAVIWPPFREGELNWKILQPPARFEEVAKTNQ